MLVLDALRKATCVQTDKCGKVRARFLMSEGRPCSQLPGSFDPDLLLIDRSPVKLQTPVTYVVQGHPSGACTLFDVTDRLLLS